MPLTLDLTLDFGIWDNSESGILTNVSYAPTWDQNTANWDNPGWNWTDLNDSNITIATAQGCTLTRRELAASDGAYTPRDKVWLIPFDLLGGYEPKPRDIWTDSLTSTTWTILNIARAAFGESISHYICTSRNLILENNLIDQIDIERCAVVLDSSGAIVQTYPPAGGTTTYPQLACRVQLQDSETADIAGIRDQEDNILIYLSRQIAIDTITDRVNFGGVYYDIIKLTLPERIDELPVLECKLRP